MAVQLLDYIHLNPVKGALDSLEAYRWSSFKAYQLGYDPFDICDAEIGRASCRERV